MRKGQTVMKKTPLKNQNPNFKKSQIAKKLQLNGYRIKISIRSMLSMLLLTNHLRLSLEHSKPKKMRPLVSSHYSLRLRAGK